MHAIDLDGVPAWYYPAGEDVPPDVTEDVFRYEFRYDALTMDHPRLRQVILPKGTNGLNATLFAVLHWDDGTDLAMLDRMLSLGADADGAIARGLLCEVHGATCPNCGGDVRAPPSVRRLRRRRHPQARPRRAVARVPQLRSRRLPPHVEVLEA